MNRFYLIILLSSLLAGCGTQREWVMEGSGMVPTINKGDVVVVDESIRDIDKLKRWDMVLIESPQDPGYYIAIRVVGLPGDHIRINGGNLFINNKLIDKEWPYYKEPKIPGNYYGIIIKDLVVPPGALYVLGDNSEHSLDSRIFGCVSESLIVGRIVAVK